MSLPRLKLNPQTNEVERQDTQSNNKGPMKAFGGPPQRKPSLVVREPFKSAYREDLQWAAEKIDARLYEIDLQFGPKFPERKSEEFYKSASHRQRELAHEERELKILHSEIEHHIPKALSAMDTPQKARALDKEVQNRLEVMNFQINRWERQAEYREARIRRLIVPQLRIDLRKEFFRSG